MRVNRRKHIESLIQEHGITVVFDGKYEFHGISREVHLKKRADIESLEGYLSALHEIGHFVCGHGKPKDWNDEANMELAAWAWALRHCQESLKWFVVQRMLSNAILPSATIDA